LSSSIAARCHASLRRLSFFQCRELLAALDVELPVYWGNRNWHPMLADTLRTMADRGVRRVVAVATSA